MNNFKTGLLLIFLTLLLVWVGNILGGSSGAATAFIFALVMNFFAYWFSDKIVLSMYRAKEAQPQEAPDLFTSVRRIATLANIPVPKVYIIPQEGMNAFATGRDPQHAAVAVTDGILHHLNRDELEGVLAHEISHVKNRDILISTIVAAIAGAITMLASWARWGAIFGGFGGRDRDNEGAGNALSFIIMMILAPIAATLIQLAISRSREYQADETSAKITGRPLSLAQALAKLNQAKEMIPLVANPSTAHMFIVNPSFGMLANLFSTHPPMEARIKRLQDMAVGNI